MKASDITDLDLIRAVNEAAHQAWWPNGPQPPPSGRWVCRWDLGHLGPDKVVLAKARRLIRRGLMDGCDCGCRGDFVLTDAGRELLAE